MKLHNRSKEWYAQLRKPKWAPPSWIFGPVWSILYIIIAISFGYTFYLVIAGGLPFIILLPFLLNLIFNIAYSPIQFGLKNNPLAMIDVLLVLGTLMWALSAIYWYMPWIAIVNLPYLAWALFASGLQITVTYLNRRSVA